MELNSNDDGDPSNSTGQVKLELDNEIKIEPSNNVSPDYATPIHTKNSSDTYKPNDKDENTIELNHRDHTQKRKNTPPKKIVSKKPRETVECEEDTGDSNSEAEESYFIIITEMPQNMPDIKDYLTACGVTKSICILDNYHYIEGKIKLKFQSIYDYHKVQRRLTVDKARGINIGFTLSGQDDQLSDDQSDSTTEIGNHGSRSLAADLEDRDPLGIYGLRLEFLRSLEIIPPLDRWVHVTNFRCDKFELRDVMELAGRVLSCSVVNITKRYAKVQYSHPLEAVQAVSMLNGQIFFGMKLLVVMERNPSNDIILPKGLLNIGLGLGLYGKPVRDIAKQYEIFTSQQNSTLNPIIFRTNFDDTNFYGNSSNTHGENQISFRELMSLTKRSFEVKHAEDLDSNDGVQSEKDPVKIHHSPSNSLNSINSPASSIHDANHDRSTDYKTQDVSDLRLAQPEVPGSSIPVRVQQKPMGGSQSGSLPHPNLDQKQPKPLGSTSFRPAPAGPTGQISNNQYTTPNQGPVNPMQNNRIRPIPPPISNPIGNPPHPGPFGITQYRQLGNGFHNPGAGYSGNQAYAPGPLGTPGFRPGPIHGPWPIPGSVMGPGAVQRPVHVQAPIRGSMPGPAHVHAPGPVQGPASGFPQSGPGPIGPPGTKSTVEFSNLPPSTTFPFLCDKLSQIGQVVSLRFTTLGCAVATFGHPSLAERCYQTYNGMTVEGYRIVVTIV